MRTESATRTKCAQTKWIAKTWVLKSENVRFLINIILHVARFYAIIIIFFSYEKSIVFQSWNGAVNSTEHQKRVTERTREKRNLWQFGMAFSNHLLYFLDVSYVLVCSRTYPIFITLYNTYTHTHINASRATYNEARINGKKTENEAKWQPMSSIFCCLDRIYITLTRARHKLDHTNQLTGCVFLCVFVYTFIPFFYTVLIAICCVLCPSPCKQSERQQQ